MGFVKIGLRKGASLVPVFSFGENDLFGAPERDEWLVRLQVALQKKMGFGLPLFFGCALKGGLLYRLGLRFGVMPLRMPVHAVTGNPIHLPKIENPTSEEIDEWHEKYIKELQKVHENFREEHDKLRRSTAAKFDPNGRF